MEPGADITLIKSQYKKLVKKHHPDLNPGNAESLTKMQEKYGKDRAYLNNDNFRNAWANSYNPIAFIIQNTNRQNIPQKDKDKIIDYYTHDMSRDQLDTLANNMKNLKRLERGDF